MTDPALLEIIRSCLEQDRLAHEMYSELAGAFRNEDIAGFWQEMAREERQHLVFWEALLGFASQGGMPQLFEDPAAVLEGLARGARNVRELAILCKGCDDINRAFILCYRLEASLMHPAFETLFRYAEDSRLPLDPPNPDLRYTDHIQRFIDAVSRFGRVTPEMELIGELLVKLWEETKAYVSQVHTDSLTGILNRRGFFKVIAPMVHLCARNGESAGLLMVDLDNFKLVNDAHGHQTGDKVLASTARAIQDSLRRSDVVGRYGGEEFSALLPGCDMESLSLVAEKIRARVEGIAHHGVSVTVSIGAAHLDTVRSPEEMDRLISQADLCLYQAKRDGRNTVYVDCTPKA